MRVSDPIDVVGNVREVHKGRGLAILVVFD
jgi:hypothetical protein